MKFKQIFIINIFFILTSCITMPQSSKSINQKKFSQVNLQIAEKLIAQNSQQTLVKKAVLIHNNYYSEVKNNLENLHKLVVQVLAQKNHKDARNAAIKRMQTDAKLMQEVQDYIKSHEIDHNNSLIRFGYNKTAVILNLAIKELQNDQFFNNLVKGEMPYKFAWNSLTMMGGVKNYDEKGSAAISILAAALLYLLPQDEMLKAVKNNSAIVYNESITQALANNAELLQKIRQNYYLFTAQNDVVSKIYEAYEFGGDVNLAKIYDAKFLPLDCSSGISSMLDITQHKFSTYHLASYYNEFFKENSVYWNIYDWQIRDEIIAKLQPIKFDSYKNIKAGDIISWRSLNDEKSLKDPKGYVGDSGHIGVVIGEDDGKIYYFSWMRNLDERRKSGFGVDVIDVKSANEKIADYKLAVSLFRQK